MIPRGCRMAACAVLSLAAAYGGGCALRPSSTLPEIAGALTVNLQLQTGATHAMSPALVRPARRDAFPGSALPYAGGSTITAMAVAPTKRTSIVFVLHEGPPPGQPVTINVIPAPFPDDGLVAPYEVPAPRQAIQAPCVSLIAFFVDGIGDPPETDVLVWYREGGAYTSFRVNRRHTVRATPVVRFDTRRIPLLADRRSEYLVVTEVTSHSPNFLIIGVARKPDGEYLAEVMLPPRDLSTWPSALHQDARENWEWRFYALDDREELHSQCRG